MPWENWPKHRHVSIEKSVFPLLNQNLGKFPATCVMMLRFVFSGAQFRIACGVWDVTVLWPRDLV